MAWRVNRVWRPATPVLLQALGTIPAIKLAKQSCSSADWRELVHGLHQALTLSGTPGEAVILCAAAGRDTPQQRHRHMQSHVHEPLQDTELEEIERYTTEALSYRHQPEFVHECARLLAEVRRLRAVQEQKRWTLASFGFTFDPPRWLRVLRGSGSRSAVTARERAIGQAVV